MTYWIICIHFTNRKRRFIFYLTVTNSKQPLQSQRLDFADAVYFLLHKKTPLLDKSKGVWYYEQCDHFYSTVTLFAKLRGLSTSKPRSRQV